MLILSILIITSNKSLVKFLFATIIFAFSLSTVTQFFKIKRGYYYILVQTTFAKISLDFHFKNPVFMRVLVCATIWYKPPVF